MVERNIASFLVDPRIIEEALHIPEGHEIVGAEWDFSTRTVRFFVEGPDLPTVKPGEIIPNIMPEISAHDDPVTRVREYKWNWCLSTNYYGGPCRIVKV